MKKILFIFYLVLFVFMDTTAQNQCNISTSFTSTAPNGRSVDFIGMGSPNSGGIYSWNFGDGGTTSGQHVSHIFPSSGNYLVCLKFIQIKPNLSHDTCIAYFCDTITIAKPNCNISTSFTVSQQSGRTVSLLANSSSTLNGQYNWNFGDGTSASGKNISHTFPYSGTFNVCLTYSQTQPNSPYDTCFANYCHPVAIVPPACNISTSFIISNQVGRSASFSGLGAPNSSGQYFWNFSDGTTALGQNVNHTFPSSGAYSVCLTFLQGIPNFPYDSCATHFCDTIVVAGQNCNIRTGFSIAQQSKRTITFSGNASNTSNGQYIWNFGDGTSGTGKNITHTFPSSGNYNVCLTLRQAQTSFPNDTCTAVYCSTVIIEKPICNISTRFYTNVIHDNTFNFSGTSSSLDSIGQYSWRFGDGTIAYGQSVTHTYNSSGTYLVCLTFMQAVPDYPYDSCIAYFCDSITIAGPNCNINTGYTTIAQKGRSVSLSGNSSSPFPGSYIWNFGDGTIDYGQDVNHTFPSSGHYNICVTFIQPSPNFPNDTCKAYFCNSILIADSACNASTSFTSTLLNGRSFKFSADSSSQLSGQYIWSFGDGTSGYGQYADHTFPNAGTYNVCLTFIKAQPNNPYDSCFAFFCDTVSIAGPVCNGSASFNTVAEGGNTFSFYGTGIPYSFAKFSWSFGDGTYAYGANVSHTFPYPGTYNVCLTYAAYLPDSPNDSCFAFFCDTITIARPPCNISTSFTTAARSGRSYSFTGNNSSSLPGQYKWNFGDGTFAYGQNVNHTFSTAGTFTTCLTFTKTQVNNPYDSCFAFFCDTITVVRPVCHISTSFTFTAHGQKDFSFSGKNSQHANGEYLWDFGDGTTASKQNVNHAFHSPGTYVVCLRFIRTEPNFPYDSCMAIFCDSITVKKSGHQKPTLSLYPMPASDIINFQLGDEGKQEITIEILNNLGGIIKKGTNRNGNFIDINSLHPGLYFLRIITDNNVYTKEFLKN